MCRNCKYKLNEIFTYRKLVLKNQKKYEEKVIEMENQGMEVEYLTEEIEIKAEPMIACESPDIYEDSYEEKYDVEVTKFEETKTNRTRSGGRSLTRLYKTKRGCVQTSEKFHKDEEDFAIIEAHYELICDICPEKPKFASYRYVTRHYTQIHKMRKMFVCCGWKMKSRQLMVEHALAHKNPKVCETCGAQFVRDIQFKKHFYDCQPRYACDLCNQLFNKKKEITEHITSKHIHQPKILCEICGKELSSLASVNAHMRRKHSSTPNSGPLLLPCPECGKKFVKTNLRAHINDIHKRTEPYVCTQCGKTFATRKNYRRHVRTVHVVGRKYKCTIDGCDKALLTPESLREHIATHTGIPLYQCKFCEWSFKSAGNFYAHMRRKHKEEHAKMKQKTKNKLYGITTEQETGET